MQYSSMHEWRNKSGTADRESPSGSWKDYWIEHSGRSWPSKCSVRGCNNPATIGAHVYSRDAYGEYIVPMCDSCNHRTGSFMIEFGTEFVSANTYKV